jgi:hypothetical protein
MDWQTVIAVLIVCLSAFIIARRVWHIATTGVTSGCGKCGGCETNSDRLGTKSKPLVTLDSINFKKEI